MTAWFPRKKKDAWIAVEKQYPRTILTHKINLMLGLNTVGDNQR